MLKFFILVIFVAIATKDSDQLPETLVNVLHNLRNAGNVGLAEKIENGYKECLTTGGFSNSTADCCEVINSSRKEENNNEGSSTK